MLPVRLPLMETTENTATPSPAPTADTRRRSGRERRVPEKFQPEITIAPKRKRGDEDDVENQNPDEDDVDEEEDEDMPSEDEASPDEEEERAARPKRKKPTASSRPSRAKKPAAKKPKINGTAPANAPSITVGLPSRPKPKKTARVITGDARDGDGVYGEYILHIRVEQHADAKQLIYLDPVTIPTRLRADGTRNTKPTTKRP